MIMKRLLVLLLLAATVVSASAQRDVTKFLGIPVDGTKAEMKRKLIEKGFTPTKEQGYDYLEGEFNGRDVYVYIVTNNNKVYRIMVSDANLSDEADIKIRYNNLVGQFERNERYIPLRDYRIPDEEDISYEMTVHKKTYQTAFFQYSSMEQEDMLTLGNDLRSEMLKKYTEEQLENPTEEINSDADAIKKGLMIERFRNKLVWFQINRLYGKYGISMYYDNEYNHASGEDL